MALRKARKPAVRLDSPAALSVDPPAQPTGEARRQRVEAAIPVGMEIAGQWAWRVLAIALVLVLLGQLIIELRLLIIPFLIAIVLSALLVPFSNWLIRHRWPKWLAVVTALLGTIGVVSGLVFLVVWQVRAGFPDLQARTLTAVDGFREFLRQPPFELTDAEVNGYLNDVWQFLQEDADVLVSGALSVGVTAGQMLAGLILVLFATLIILIDGKGIWRWVVRLFPRRARAAIDGAGITGWLTLTRFARVQIFVAFVDAIGIGAGAFFLGVPLAIPIAIAVFLGSFIPFVGAIVTGALAVLIALIYNGPIIALILLGIVLLVQQIEGNVLQPLVMGSAVRVHPLAVVLAVTAGAFVAGIPGAFFAVPIVAVLNVMVKYIASGAWRGQGLVVPDPLPADDVPPDAAKKQVAPRRSAPKRDTVTKK